MKQPFKNKTDIDPGRLRYGIKFYKQIAPVDAYGGTPAVTETLVLTTKCAELQISSYDQLAISAGASRLTKDRYFIIRKRKVWEPEKGMTVQVKGEKYTLRGIIDLDQPQHYWKLLCVWQG